MKLHRFVARRHDTDSTKSEQAGYTFKCPGCNCLHAVWVEQANPGNNTKWTFNGDLDRPTFSPSLNIVGKCHSFISNGFIQYLSDSTHSLAGQTVELPEWENSKV